MAPRPSSLLISDAESRTHLSDSDAVLAGADWSIRRTTLQSGLSQGVEVVDLCNGPLTVAVLPTRGMGIWFAQLGQTRLGWQSPVRLPVHPAFVNLESRNGLGWLDGFNELLCRCGLSSNGPPGVDPEAASPIESQLTLHGKIANLPAHRVEFASDESTGEISVTGIVDECTLFGPQLRLKSTVSTRIGSNEFKVIDEVTNLGAGPTEFELLYHTNIGRPFLEEGSRFALPHRKIDPRDPRAAEGIASYNEFLGPTPGYAEQVYLFEPAADANGECAALLQNKSGHLGLRMTFQPQQLPCFALWKCTQPEAAGYVCGLEPATNFPNFKADERKAGRVIRLELGAVRRSELRLEILTSATAVTDALRQIEDSQSHAK